MGDDILGKDGEDILPISLIGAVLAVGVAACCFSHVPQSPITTRAVVLGWHGIAWAGMGVKGKLPRT